jgi:hypothetical protein
VKMDRLYEAMQAKFGVVERHLVHATNGSRNTAA